ncbi:hypothetical protein OG203_44260 [Nocardia sp. NBC_01499]|uniref:hypothetical protein n=1 Tax=Nocardia sp. NBC_01499 TaxID=2903597 RepID=UPI0038642995
MSNDVNLFVRTQTVTVDATGKGVATFTVGNFGPNPTVGNSSLKVTTPFFVNIDSTGVLPPGMVTLFQDLRPDVPSIVKVPVGPGLAAGATQTINIPFMLLPGAPTVAPGGRATFTTEPGSADNDLDLSRNSQQYYVIRSVLPVPANGTVSLLYTYDNLFLKPANQCYMPVHLFNNGPNPTQKNSYLTLFTPFYVNFGSPFVPPLLPLGITFDVLYSNPDPSVPEIARVKIPPGLGGLLNNEITVQIPLVSVAGGPRCSVAGGGIYVPDLANPTNPDTDPDRSTNHHPFGLVLLGS